MTLTDTQAILLSASSQRDSGSLYPLPATITTKPGSLAKSIGALRTRGLIAGCCQSNANLSLHDARRTLSAAA